MDASHFHGIIPPLPTIVDSAGAFDPSGMAALLDYVIDNGVDGVLALGSTGEFCYMDRALRETVAAFVVRHVGGRVPVIVGTGAPGTAETIRLTRHAQDIGADAAMVITPYYAPLDDEKIVRHYRDVAASVTMPLFLYNYPDMTGLELSADLIARLATECPNIVGVKESVSSASHIRQVIKEVKGRRPDFLVFCGYDEHLLNTLALGGDGAIPACANFAPVLLTGLYHAFVARDFERCLTLHRAIAALSPIYGLDTPFYSVIKEAVRQAGVPVSTAVLPPGRPLSEAAKKGVTALLKGLALAPG